MYNTNIPTHVELPSTAKLLRSTVVAALVAVGLLVTAILPAEYGIDPTGIGRYLNLTKMGEIKASLAAESNDEAGQASAAPTQPAVVEAPAQPASPETAAPLQHTTSIILKPGQATEIKLLMRKDARVQYAWTTQGGPVNYDTHGDPVGAAKSFYHGYGKGRNATSDAGTLQAAFDGKHGWFWRNRSNAPVTVTLKSSGEYEKLERVF